jgi:hypothetical protein
VLILENIQANWRAPKIPRPSSNRVDVFSITELKGTELQYTSINVCTSLLYWLAKNK